MNLAVLVTCFNRVDVTIAGLTQLLAAFKQHDDVAVTIFLVDDASPDQTGKEISRLFPDVKVEFGNGALFWNRGMCRAYEVARAYGNHDAYLLFNDDVLVEGGALQKFLSEFRRLNIVCPSVLAAATTDSDGNITYSGMRRLSRYRPLAVEKIYPTGDASRCDTFNGNFVMIPGPFFENIGGLDPKYAHSYGDIDLGYVAAASGAGPYLAGEPIGRCDANATNHISGRGAARIVSALRSSWGRRDSIQQRAHFILKHAPFPAALPLIVMSALKRVAERLVSRIGNYPPPCG